MTATVPVVDPDRFVEMSCNGTVVVPRTPKRTMTSEESYLKQGLYRDGDE
ncbi:MAG: hypothetical protein ACR2GH_17320 [Pseudonocardia sp.]